MIVRFRMYIYFEKELVLIARLRKITINVGNHQNIAFHSKSLDMSHPCISYVNICSITITINNNNNNFPISYMGCLQDVINILKKTDPSIFTCPAHTIDFSEEITSIAVKWEHVRIDELHSLTAYITVVFSHNRS